MALSKASDSKILELKERGMSLRQVASALEMSHVAVLKRLKTVKASRKVVTYGGSDGLPLVTGERSVVSTSSKADKSRVSEEPEDTVNQLVTKKTPSVTISQGVNPLETPCDKLPECKKGVFQEVVSESGDLFEKIKVFLESKGIEVYRMQVEPEAYQVRRNDQVIRFYVQRADGRVS